MRGFTLLEILVALAVFAFLVLGLTQGTRFGLAAWDRQARTVDRARDGPPRPGHQPQMSRDALSRNAVYALTPCGIATVTT